MRESWELFNTSSKYGQVMGKDENNLGWDFLNTISDDF